MSSVPRIVGVPESMRRSRESLRFHPIRWAVIGLIAGTIIGGGTGYYLGRHSVPPIVSVSKPLTTTAAAQDAAAQTQKVSLAKPSPVTPITIAGNGEGVEHPLIRQIAANPSLVDFKACRIWQAGNQRTGCNAHLLCVQAGLCEWKHGEYMRVNKPGTVAIVIEKDTAGNLTVALYPVPTAASRSSSGITQPTTYHVAASVGASHFIGPMDGTSAFQTPYLYMYPG